MDATDAKFQMIYGTAWKKEDTTKLVEQALLSGFRAIDVASQPRHYREDLVGNALQNIFSRSALKRSDIWVQSKFTSVEGQDINTIPYDPTSSPEIQVRQSVLSSLKHFRLNDSQDSVQYSYLDCVILHSPMPTIEETIVLWKALEEFVPAKVRYLGIANVDLPTLQTLHEISVIKPAVVQCRFYPGTGYDFPVRQFCKENRIQYQAFWTITANPNLINSNLVAAISKNLKIEKPVALYSLVLGLGNISILNGTTREERMTSDLQGLENVKKWAEENSDGWESLMNHFKELIGEESK